MQLRRNFSWTFAGNFTYAASQFLVLTVLAKFGTPEMVGQYALGNAIAIPIITFTNLALRQVQATDTHNQYNFGEYLALRLLMTLIGLVAVVIIALNSRYPFGTTLIILAIGVARGIEAISDVFYGLMQSRERMDSIAQSMIAKAVFSISALSLGVYLSKSVFWGVVGLILAWSIVLFGYDLRNSSIVIESTHKISTLHLEKSNYLLPRWNLLRLRTLFWLTLPLGIATMLNSLSTNLPRIYVERYLGHRELGIFAALAYLIMIGGIIVNALGQSASPRLAKMYSTGNKEAFLTLLIKLVGISLIVGLLSIVATLIVGKPLLKFFYTPEYAERTGVLLWLNVGATIFYMSSVLGFGMTAAKNYKAQPYIFGLTSTISVICSVWLIPVYGLIGAAWVLLIVGFTQGVFTLLCVAHSVRKIQNSTTNSGVV